jgi:excisionase family DNA binding protein
MKEVQDLDYTQLPIFLTPKEVARMFGVPVCTVYQWVSDGVIPYRKAGRLTRFLLDDILEWTIPHKEEK